MIPTGTFVVIAAACFNQAVFTKDIW